MDNLRLIIFLALAFVVLALYQAWQKDYAPVAPSSTQISEATRGASVSAVPAAPVTDVADVPQVPTVGGDVAMPTATASRGGLVSVVTDVLDLKIDTHGGSVVSSVLKEFPVSIEDQENKVVLLNTDPVRYYVAQSGLMGSSAEIAPTHEAEYTVSQTEYTLADGEDALKVTLVWNHESGVEVRKHYHFTRGSYNIRVDHEVVNNSTDVWSGRSYQQLQRSNEEIPGKSAFMYTYLGGAIYTEQNKFEKIEFDDMLEGNLSKETQGGWLSILQHYFLTAWIPAPDQLNHYYSKALGGNRFMLGSYSPAISVQPGETQSFSSHLLVGPKLQETLVDAAPGLELTRDYGWLAVIAKPMYWVIEKIHSYVGNWGWSIIFFTILLKLAFYKLSETSYRSMANMRKFTPRIQALKDRYGDDKERLQKAMMEIYKTEKVNPLGGCLPMLVQMPFFIALYWVLLESVELRQAPWFLWIQDLSIKDPFFILPAVMGASMFIQQRLNPTPPDPMQAKMMQALPIVFTVFFAFFPAGLVLYWVTNNILSILQQWYITRQIEAASK